MTTTKTSNLSHLKVGGISKYHSQRSVCVLQNTQGEIVEKRMSQTYGFKQMSAKQKSSLKGLWPSFSLAKSLNLNESINTASSLIPKNLNHKFSMKVKQNIAVHSERGAKIRPMGWARSTTKKIEFNAYYSWANVAQWSNIFWHEMAHLVDHHFISYSLIYDKVAQNANNFKKNKKRLHPINKANLKYFTSADYKEHTSHQSKYERATMETFAESFSMIMMLATFGSRKDVLKSLKAKSSFIKNYLIVILELFNWINFEGMGIRISLAKKNKMKQLFKELAK